MLYWRVRRPENVLKLLSGHSEGKLLNSLKDATESWEAKETQKVDKVHPICHTILVP